MWYFEFATQDTSVNIAIMNASLPPLVLYNAAQVRELDRRAIQDFWIPGATLMARAGKSVFHTLRQQWPKVSRFAVVCGVGNNAGDGYVVARLAQEAGLNVRVIQVGEPSRLQGDAQHAYDALLATGLQPTPFTMGCLQEGDDELLVDALLGTGLKGDVREPLRTVITAMNRRNTPILAVDIPSGLCADTGRVLGVAVRARTTVTFIGRKLGLFTGEGPAYCGAVIFSDLEVPPEVYLPVAASARMVTLEELPLVLPQRQRTAHKGDFGHVLVMGGAPGYAGAARLAAEAAARVGAGLVSVATHPDHAAQIAAMRPEIMAHAVTSGDDLAPLLTRATVIVLGPGLSRTPWAQALWEATWQTALATRVPMVIDADALNLLAQCPGNGYAPLPADWIFTPHPGEAARLLHGSAADIQANRVAALESLVRRYGGIWVLKGAGTLIGSAKTLPGLCAAANPGMASGGMGDVLAGVLGGLLAQSVPAYEAACLGVCLHAEAAQRAVFAGERGTIASDLMPHLRELVNVPAHLPTWPRHNKKTKRNREGSR